MARGGTGGAACAGVGCGAVPEVDAAPGNAAARKPLMETPLAPISKGRPPRGTLIQGHPLLVIPVALHTAPWRHSPAGARAAGWQQPRTCCRPRLLFPLAAPRETMRNGTTTEGRRVSRHEAKARDGATLHEVLCLRFLHLPDAAPGYRVDHPCRSAEHHVRPVHARRHAGAGAAEAGQPSTAPAATAVAETGLIPRAGARTACWPLSGGAWIPPGAARRVSGPLTHGRAERKQAAQPKGRQPA